MRFRGPSWRSAEADPPCVGREARRLRPEGRAAANLRSQRGRTEVRPFAQHLESATPERVLGRWWRLAGLRRTVGVSPFL